LLFQHTLVNIPNLTVTGFHELCGIMARKAGIKIPNIPTRELYETFLPNALYEALKVQPGFKWQTVIVDEGQDFHPDWWIAIDQCIQADGELRVFMDSNQRVYDRAPNITADLTAVPIRLSRNI